MTKDEVWAKFCEVNPLFLREGDVCVNSARIRKMIETAYKYGDEAGFENGKRVANMLNKATNGKLDAFKQGAGADLFSQLFGGKNK